MTGMNGLYVIARVSWDYHKGTKTDFGNAKASLFHVVFFFVADSRVECLYICYRWEPGTRIFSLKMENAS